MILAGDIGGTKSRLALFDPGRLEPLRIETYRTAEHESLGAIVQRFLRAAPAGPIGAAGFGVAGLVEDCSATGINLPWPVHAHELAEVFEIPVVAMVNDLEANARGISLLRPDDFVTINRGRPSAAGNRVVVSAGTGLGDAGLVWDGTTHHAVAGEGGHMDFAPRTEIEVALLRHLTGRFGHVSYERVCSGLGILEIYRFLGGNRSTPADAAAVAAEAAADPLSIGAHALDLFASIYGAHAGNMALTFMATGGVYLGGGIAPKLIDRLAGGSFMAAFLDKGRFAAVMERVPVHVVLNDHAALLGAALVAAERDARHRQRKAVAL